MFSTPWRASSQIQCETSSFVKSFLEDTPQGQCTLSAVNNLVCEEKHAKPLFSTPLHCASSLLCWDASVANFANNWGLNSWFFKSEKKKRRKNEDFIKGDIKLSILEMVCKGRRQVGRRIGRPEPESRGMSLKALPWCFEEWLRQRANATLVLFHNRLFVSLNLSIG